MNRLVVILLAAAGTVSVSLGTLSAVSGQTGDAPVAQPAPAVAPERKYPSLPDAVRVLPEWVVKDAPFDVERYFQPIPDDENAAPLYFDALYEFSPGEMQICIAPAEQARRGPALIDLARRTGQIMTANPPAVDPAPRALIVAEYADSFDKLARAQKRPHCVFETGIGIAAKLPHAQSARQVVRLLDWRVEGRIAARNVDGALDDVAMALRLSRDLRPRGPIISQLVSMALDSVVASSLIPKVLGARDLKTGQCDRLFELVTRHAADEIEPLTEGFRYEYVMQRDMLHQLELKPDPLILAELSAQAKGTLETMTPADFALEGKLLNRYFRPMVAAGAAPKRGAFQLNPEQQEALAEMNIFKEFLPGLTQVAEACRRDRTRLACTRCLITLRRWQLKSKNANPPDLHVLCKDVGMTDVPVDEYSPTGERLRWALIGGDFVIYSVGADGKDDQGLVDWKFGQQPGDWVFRLPAKP